jgi:hypothetical protein
MLLSATAEQIILLIQEDLFEQLGSLSLQPTVILACRKI